MAIIEMFLGILGLAIGFPVMGFSSFVFIFMIIDGILRLI